MAFRILLNPLFHSSPFDSETFRLLPICEAESELEGARLLDPWALFSMEVVRGLLLLVDVFPVSFDVVAPLVLDPLSVRSTFSLSSTILI
jgi:hypothetical protein